MTAVTFSVRRVTGKTIITASANQRPSVLAWVIGIVGVAASFVPTIAVAFWYVFSKNTVQRELWRVLDEVAEELEAPVATVVSVAEPLPDAERKTCPYCAETVKSAAVLCRFCGKDLPISPAPAAARRPAAPAPAVPPRPQEQFCSSCDTKVDATAKVCPKCGCGAFCDTPAA